MSDGLTSTLRKAAFAAALAIGLASGAAQAATLYISEFGSAVSQIGSAEAQVYPQPAITDQTVAITGSSAQSAAFNASTHAVTVECDTDCSVLIGDNPTATTTNYLMGDGIPYHFAVAPGQKIAVIANTSGGNGSDVNIASVGGNAVTTTVPVSGSVAVTGGSVGLLGGTASIGYLGGYSFANITTSTTTTVKSGAGVLHLVNVNALGTVASLVTVYDNTAGSGTKIATINSLTLSGAFAYDIAFSTGLTVVTTGAPDITVSYR